MGRFPSLKLFFVAVLVTLGGSFHFGYQLVLTNPSQDAFMAFLNGSHMEHYGRGLELSEAKTVWSIIVALFFVGAIFGSLSLSTVSGRLGRKRGLCVSIAISIVGVLLSIISYHVYSFELYIASRIIAGYAISLSLGLSAIFFNESSPKACRGFVSMMMGTVVNLGTLVGAVICMPTVLGSIERWWYIYLIEIILLAIVLLILPFVPESPAFLLLLGDEKAARKAVQFFHSCSVGAVDLPLWDLKENLRLSSTRMSPVQVFADKYARKGTIVGVIISFAMSFSGIAVINAFVVPILMQTGLEAQNASFANIGLCGVSVLSSMAAMVVVDRFGRRPLILISLGAIIILNFAIFALMYSFDKYGLPALGYSMIAVIALFLFFFAVGPGPLSFFVATETVGQSARGVSQGCSSLVQMVSRFVLLAIYLPMADAIGQSISYLILFILPVIVSEVYLYFNMPETKNKDQKEVIEAMDNLPSFSKCTGTMKRQVHPQPQQIPPPALDRDDDDSCAGDH